MDTVHIQKGIVLMQKKVNHMQKEEVVVPMVLVPTQKDILQQLVEITVMQRDYTQLP